MVRRPDPSTNRQQSSWLGRQCAAVCEPRSSNANATYRPPERFNLDVMRRDSHNRCNGRDALESAGGDAARAAVPLDVRQSARDAGIRGCRRSRSEHFCPSERLSTPLRPRPRAKPPAANRWWRDRASKRSGPDPHRQRVSQSEQKSSVLRLRAASASGTGGCCSITAVTYVAHDSPSERRLLCRIRATRIRAQQTTMPTRRYNAYCDDCPPSRSARARARDALIDEYLPECGRSRTRAGAVCGHGDAARARWRREPPPTTCRRGGCASWRWGSAWRGHAPPLRR